MSKAVAALHAFNAVFDEMNPTGTIAFGTTGDTGRMALFLTHRGIVHESRFQFR
jgi:hypothetical protein